jgi:hypothetical protein
VGDVPFFGTSFILRPEKHPFSGHTVSPVYRGLTVCAFF